MTIETKKKIVGAVLAVAVLSIFAYAIYQNKTVEPVVDTSPHAELNARADAIETYVKTNISTLSPVQATMGGTFYVTRIRILNGEGTVNYEDGHMAYVADFTYTVSDDNSVVEVLSFTLREDQ